MINFDSLTLKALLEEITPVTENARVQKIRQPNRQELILTLRSNSKNHTLFISIKPSFAHICLLEEENKNYRLFDFPQSPPMFCMLLRKYLENAKIEKVVQPEHERIVEFYFTAYGELGESIKLVLAAELMGKHSNMILYNAKDKRIIGCAHNVGEEKSKERELAGGFNYVYPPQYYKKDILKISAEEFINLSKSINTTFYNWLNETFYDISVPLAKEVCKSFNIHTEKDFGFTISKEILEQIFSRLKEILSLKKLSPCISDDFQEFSLNGTYNTKCRSVNSMVDLYFGKNTFDELIERKKRCLKSTIDREIKKIKRLEKKLSAEENSEEKILMYKKFADTLMANVYLKTVNDNKIELADVYTGKILKIDVDSALSVSDNAQNYYKLYNKAKKTKENNEIILNKYKTKENYLLSIKSAIMLSTGYDTLVEIEEEIADLLQKSEKKQPGKAQKTVVEKTEAEGFEIYIGKNNKQNDYVVSKLAFPEDFWFHVHGDFGSHVLVKNKLKLETLPDEIILKAALLAAKYSERKNDKKVNVIYTKRKYLRKPPGANPGYVTYKNEREITVEIPL